MNEETSESDRSKLQQPGESQTVIRLARPRLVRDAAFEEIKDAIIHGRLKPGERLVERKLCEATGVGRSSIREVIRRLEADSLVTMTAHQGPAVARLTLEQAGEIYELRADLEARLVRGYCFHAKDADLERISKFLPEIRAAELTRDRQALVGIMLRFNDHIMDVARLEVTSDLLRVLLARISWLRVLSMTQPNRVANSIVEIGALVEALHRRNPQEAEDAVRYYIANAGCAALEQMRSSPSWF
jgi:DNA-binding GntR family transcriptional regulator